MVPIKCRMNSWSECTTRVQGFFRLHRRLTIIHADEKHHVHHKGDFGVTFGNICPIPNYGERPRWVACSAVSFRGHWTRTLMNRASNTSAAILQALKNFQRGVNLRSNSTRLARKRMENADNRGIR